MKSTKEILNNKYYANNYRLEKSFDEAYEQSDTFKKIVSSLKCSKEELMKYTSKLEDTCKQLDNCQNCKNILECKNELEGHICYPEENQGHIIFNYIPCKYKKALDKKNAYLKNVYVYDMPRQIKEASMKNIYTDDPNRFEVIKKIKKILDTYDSKKSGKGLYLTGNFGCGKTYLLAAMLNELAKRGHKIAIIYYPEFLRSLKSNFNVEEEYNNLFNYIKT